MALDPTIEHLISTTIESQFPAYYRDEGPVLVGFVRKYFEWMETEGGTLYHARRIPEYKDIDTTVDDFIVHFKEKYLKNIQLETTSNVRQLVKHSLDIYRSRGTERAIDLLFRLVFGVGAKVYYPSTDMMRLSDGRWVRPVYLEVTSRTNLDQFVGKQVVGSDSGATAFVERYIRRKSPGKFVDVLYISAVEGFFKTGELLKVSDGSIPLRYCPHVTGSLTNLSVLGGGSGYDVGDEVEVDGEGYRGLARVVSVADSSGIVTFSVVDGGFGYTTASQVLVSNVVLAANQVTLDPALRLQRDYYGLFENVVQEMANVTYTAATSQFVEGEAVYTYNVDNSVKGSGRVLSVKQSNTTAGELRLSVWSGNLNSTAIYKTGNTASATTSGYADCSAVGKILVGEQTSRLSFNSKLGTFEVGQQLTSNGATATVLVVGGNYLDLGDRSGVFSIDATMSTATGSATIADVTGTFGVINVGNTFLSGGRVRGATTNTQLVVTGVGAGTGATAGISATLKNQETLSLNTDPLSNYASVQLNATQYNLPKAPTANLSSVIDTALTYASTNVGTIQYLVNVSGGTDYTMSPLVRVYEPKTYGFKRRGWLLTLTDATFPFVVGEVVTQATTGAKGEVTKGSSTTSLYLSPLTLFKEFQVGYAITGESGATASVTEVCKSDGGDQAYFPTQGQYAGLNADIDAETVSAAGSVTELEVTDSGFGYANGETVSFFGGSASPGTARAGVYTQGTGSGYYREKGGFLSDDKKLRDGWYYQEYSYDVQSSLTLNRYRDMLREILHVAGTKAFGTLRLEAAAECQVDIAGDDITIHPAILGVDALPREIAVAGPAVKMVHTTIMHAVTYSGALTGSNIALTKTRNFPVTFGSFVLAGKAAGVSRKYSSAVGSGSFVAGSWDMYPHRTLIFSSVAAGSFAESGKAVIFKSGRGIAGGTGVFGINTTGTVYRGKTLVAEVGAIALTRVTTQNMRTTRRLTMAARAFTRTGQAATLTYTPAASSSTLWTPSNLSTAPALWFDAQNSSSVIRSGSSVTSWHDISGNARHLTPTNSSPVYNATGINSKPSIQFTSDAIRRLKGSWSYSGNKMTVYSMFTHNNTGDFMRVFSASTAGSMDWDDPTRCSFDRAGNSTSFQMERGGTSAATSSTAVPYSTPSLVGFIWGAGGNYIYQNGTVQNNGTYVGSFGFTDVAVGCQANSDDGRWDGHMGEVLVLGYEPSTADRQKIEGYMAWRWGTQASLPSTHPYKNAAPTTGSTSVTLDPAKTTSGLTLTNNNLTATNGGGNNNGVFVSGATVGYSTGKRFFSVRLGNGAGSGITDVGFGLVPSTYPFSAPPSQGSGGAIGQGTGTIGFGGFSGNIYKSAVNLLTVNNSEFWNDGAVCDVAVDFDNRRAWFRFAGNPWNGDSGANPSTNVGGFDISDLASTLYPAVGPYDNGDAITANFGASAFTYAMPSGYSAWGTGAAAPSGTLLDTSYDSRMTISSLTYTQNSANGTFAKARANKTRSYTGKWYWETEPVVVGNSTGSPDGSFTSAMGVFESGMAYTSTNLGGDGSSFGLYASGQFWSGGSQVASTSLTWDGSFYRVMMAVDFGAGLVWFRTSNGSQSLSYWNGSSTANPATGVGGFAFSITSGTMCAGVMTYNNGDKGNAAFSSSQFLYTPPSGFSSWGV